RRGPAGRGRGAAGPRRGPARLRGRAARLGRGTCRLGLRDRAGGLSGGAVRCGLRAVGGSGDGRGALPGAGGRLLLARSLLGRRAGDLLLAAPALLLQGVLPLPLELRSRAALLGEL